MSDAGHQRTSLIVLVVLVGALLCYFGVYARLRSTHVIVHYQNMAVRGGHKVTSDSLLTNIVFAPPRLAETLLHRLRGRP